MAKAKKGDDDDAGGFDVAKDMVLLDLGTLATEGVTASFRSYDGGPTKLAVVKVGKSRVRPLTRIPLEDVRALAKKLKDHAAEVKAL